jgi:KaiC/GvpD/RAD55 family RecA-like ATPase
LRWNPLPNRSTRSWAGCNKTKTIIPKQDDFLEGGIPEGSSVLFYADPGVECELLVIKHFKADWKKEIAVLYSLM